MKTRCDRYWYNISKKSLIILLCTLPIALLFPILSLIIPMFLLYAISDKFFTFHTTGEKQDDSIRFIMTMPFSRKDIFYTYTRGLLSTSSGYFIVIGVIRLILMLAKLSRVFFWGSNINTGHDLMAYMAILLLCLLISCYFLIHSINNYTSSKISGDLAIYIFLIVPALCILQFLKTIIVFFTRLSSMEITVEYDHGDILWIGMPENIASVLNVIIFVIIISIVLYGVILAISKDCRKFIGRGERK